MGIGILGDEARVVGGDTTEPMGSCRGHLEETVERISHQYSTKLSIQYEYKTGLLSRL